MILLCNVWLVFRTGTVNSCKIFPAFCYSSVCILTAFAVDKDESREMKRLFHH